MAITEGERYDLVENLIATLGREQAETLMKCILPDGWEHLATKQDVEIEAARNRVEFSELRGEFGDLRGDFGELRGEFGELRGDFGELKGEFGELRGEWKGEFGELRGDFGELRGEFGELRGEFGELKGEFGELRGDFRSALAKQTRLILFAVMGFALTTWVALLVPLLLLPPKP